MALYEEVKNCSFENWYDKFRRITFRSEIIELPEDFIKYLNEDSIILPSLPPSETLHGYDPRITVEGNYSDDEETNEHTSNIHDSNNDDMVQPCFPELEKEISLALTRLGGIVFPKLNWNAPRDAAWMTGSLKCTTPGEIFLLLKSSDAIASNFSRAFADCLPSSLPLNISVQRPNKLYLILRKWCKLLPSREFRCFVRDNVLIGVCQRDTANYYSHLVEEREVLLDVIDTFFMRNIKDQYYSSNFTFDIYVDRNNKVYLVDFGVYGNISDSLLFDWNELNEIEILKDCECELRVVEVDGGLLPSDQVYFGLPKDLLDISTPEGLNRFITMSKHMNEENDSEDETKETNV